MLSDLYGLQVWNALYLGANVATAGMVEVLRDNLFQTAESPDKARRMRRPTIEGNLRRTKHSDNTRRICRSSITQR